MADVTNFDQVWDQTGVMLKSRLDLLYRYLNLIKALLNEPKISKADQATAKGYLLQIQNNIEAMHKVMGVIQTIGLGHFAADWHDFKEVFTDAFHKGIGKKGIDLTACSKAETGLANLTTLGSEIFPKAFPKPGR
jgi:hypothetical protein